MIPDDLERGHNRIDAGDADDLACAGAGAGAGDDSIEARAKRHYRLQRRRRRAVGRPGEGGMNLPASALRWIGVLLACSSLAACGRPENPDEYPVSHWLNDHEDCVRASAAAIIKSGLPFPNFTIEPVDGATGAKGTYRFKTVDMWLGGTRFVIPSEVAYRNVAYPKTHPRRYEGLRGGLPNFYPKGEYAPVKDGMGPMVDVNFTCSMKPDYVASWGKGFRSNEEGIQKVKARYEEAAARRERTKPGATKISLNRRDDIGMIELLYERGGMYNDGMPMWEATYWPIGKELKGPSGNVSAIGCKTRHDPEGRYGGIGWRCSSSMRLTLNAAAHIEIYVAHIEHMPAVFEQVKQLLVNAQQPEGE